MTPVCIRYPRGRRGLVISGSLCGAPARGSISWEHWYAEIDPHLTLCERCVQMAPPFRPHTDAWGQPLEETA